MKFVDDWQHVLRKAWSIKFILIAGFFSGLEAVVQIISIFYADALPDWLPRGAFAVFAFVASNGAFVTRLMAQRDINPEKLQREHDTAL
jgi:hypothetical protein